LIRAIIYPILLLSFTGFLITGCLLIRRYRESLKQVYRNPVALLSIIGVSTLTMIHQPFGFKTVMDEIVLTGTSRQMHLDREPLTPHRALYGRNYLVVSNSYLDKRPVFFPFLVSLVHDATGYRDDNAFALNAVLTVILFALAWGIGFAVAGRWGGVFATFALGTLPLIPMLGSGGGFEIANLLWTLFFFLGIWAVLKKTDAVSISFLCLATVLLAHLRYESALFVPFCGAALVWAWWRCRKVVVPWVLVLAPLLLVDIPLQHKVFENNTEFWQLADVDGADAVFALKYIPTNLGHALNYFLSVEDYMPNTIPLFIIGGIGLIWGALHLRHWIGGSAFERATVVLWFALLLQAVLLMTYFWGRLDDTIIHRLSLPIWLWLWIGSLFLLQKVLARPRSGMILSGTLIAFWMTFSLPLYAKAEYSTRHAPPAVFNRMAEWADNNRDGRTLIVSRNSVFWIGQDYAAIHISDPESDLPFLNRLIEHGIYSNILVSEPTTFNPETSLFEPDPAAQVHEAVIREKIFEYAVDRQFGFRISKVMGIDPDYLSENPSKESSSVEYSEEFPQIGSGEELAQ